MPVPTPTPATPTAVGTTGAYVEAPDSGGFLVNRTFRAFKKFSVQPYSYAVSNAFYRGDALVIGSADYLVNESRIKRERGQMARVEVDCDSVNVFPPDEFNLTPIDLNPRVERHPKFKPLQDADFALVRRAYDAYSNSGRQTALSAFQTSTNPDLCQLLYSKLCAGLENYYLAGWLYRWSAFFASEFPPIPNLGGFIQDPQGPLQGLLYGQWLRMADSLSTVGNSPLGTILRLEMSWQGSSAGYWDADLYGS